VILALVLGLVESLPILIEYIPILVQAIFDTIMEFLPVIVEAAVEIVLALITGLVDMLPTLAEAIPDLIETLVNGLIEAIPAIVEAGGDIAEGIWDGISAKADWMKEKVMGFAANILEGIKDALGIASPSQVAADEVGTQVPEGVGVGFVKRLPQVKKKMQSALTDAVTSLDASAAMTGITGNGVISTRGGMVVNLGGIHQNFNGKADGPTVKAATRQGVLEALRAAGAI
jgi:phage-related protein